MEREEYRRIPFEDGQAGSIEELGGAPPLRVNVLTDPSGFVRSWPGTSDWSDFPAAVPNASPVIGMRAWGRRLIYVTKDRKLYSLEGPGIVRELSDSTSATKLEGDGRPIFAVTKGRVFVAGGGRPQYWAGTGLSAQASAAPTATHIAAIAQRLVTNTTDGSGHVRFTDPLEANHLTWPALNFFEAEARPDEAKAVYDTSSELFVWGGSSLQVYQPDANLYFAPIATQTIGLGASHSIIALEDKGAFAWLDQDRHIAIGNGRGSPERPATIAVDRAIAELESVDDCWAFRARLQPYDFLVWVFPSAARAFAFEMGAGKWMELRGWDGQFWAAWPVTSYYFWPEKNAHLVGLATGQIQRLDLAATSQAGQDILCQMVSGFVNHGTQAKKQTVRIRLPVRRGNAPASGSESTVEISARDGTGAYGPVREIGLGLAGDNRPWVEKRIVGRPYVARQWKITFTSDAAAVFGQPEEKIEFLED